MKNKELKNVVIMESACAIFLALCGSFFSGIAAGVLCILDGIALTAIFVYFTKKRYEQIAGLNE